MEGRALPSWAAPLCPLQDTISQGQRCLDTLWQPRAWGICSLIAAQAVSAPRDAAVSFCTQEGVLFFPYPAAVQDRYRLLLYNIQYVLCVSLLLIFPY